MHRTALLTSFLLSLPLAAQDAAEVSPLLTDGHRALRQFVGTWECKVTMMVPGEDKPAEMTAIERTELVADGLWLKSVVHSDFMGKPFEGMTVLGFDPHGGKYHGVWIDSQSPSPNRSEGTYDAATRTFEMRTLSGQGASRSTYTWTDADHSVEVGYAKGADDKEVEVMRIVRTRAAEPPATGATTVAAEPAEPAHPVAAVLRRLPGTWTCKMEMPDGAVIPAKEKVSAVCGGQWFWSDFRTDAMGRPFEGHALWGFDVTMNHFVSYWIDSASTGFTELTGHYDEKPQVLTLHGHSIDPAGKKQRLHETIAWPSEHRRVLTMDFSTGAQNVRMTLTYDREQSTGAFKIK